MLEKIIESENLDAVKDLGYSKGAPILLLQKDNGDFSKYLHGTKELFAEQEVD